MYEIFRIGKSIKTESSLVIATQWEKGRESEGKWEQLLMGTRFLSGEDNIVWFTMVIVPQLCECTKNHWIVYS